MGVIGSSRSAAATRGLSPCATMPHEATNTRISRYIQNEEDAVSVRFHSEGERVSKAPFCADYSRSARIELQPSPKPQYLHIDAAIENIFVYARGLQQLLTSQRALRRLEKCNE